jgi:DNA-binding NarL/FixJ family response regulator
MCRVTSGQIPAPDTVRPIRVVLVDDDPIVRTGLSMILDSADGIEVVGQAADGDEVTAQVTLHQPDVVVMDIRMRRVDGIAATAKVTALPRPPRVLVLTTFDLDEYVFDALDAGAGGFLLKDASPQDIVTAVRVVADGESILAPRATRTLIGHVVAARSNPRRAEAQQRLTHLTDREREIVTAVAHGKTNAEIGDDLYLSEATVKTHITRVFAKLDLTNRVQATIFAYQAGLVTP